MAAEGVGECGGRARVSVAEFATGETGFAHFAEDGVEREIAGEVHEIVVGPDDGIGADEAGRVEEDGHAEKMKLGNVGNWETGESIEINYGFWGWRIFDWLYLHSASNGFGTVSLPNG